MRKIVPVVLLLASAACGGSDAANSANAATVRDSVGVTIVENAGPTWTEGTALVLAAEPTVSIGEMDGPPEYQLYQVRAATRLADGGIVVFDGGSQEVRYYDSIGKYIRRSGGKGGGPGEFQGATWMVRLPGDSLVLHDIQAQRITVLAPDGTVARTVNLAAAAAAPAPEAAIGSGERRVRVGGLGMYEVLGVMSDGSFLARTRGQPALAEPGASVKRDSATYVRLAADGTLRDTIGVMVGGETQASAGGSEGRRIVMIGPPPFGKSSQVALDANGFWFGASDRYQLEHRDADGRLDRIVRRTVEPIAVTPAVVEAAKKIELERRTDGPAEMRDVFRQMAEEKWKGTMPTTMPAHGALRTDAAGRLWVSETTLPDDTIPRWTAFDAEGRMLGTVAMPANFRALEFGRDYVLGVATDENEVERVDLFRLGPPEP